MRRCALLLALALPACTRTAPQPPVPAPVLDAVAALDQARERYLAVALRRNPADGHPRSTDSAGAWTMVPINDWTSAFFAGTLWHLYAHSPRHAAAGTLREQAESWTWPLARIPRGRYTHDLGFQYNSSFVNGYRFTGETRFRTPALHGARLLAARFNPRVGALKSWDWTDPQRPFPVIVDNMMNLELLFWGARQPEGDPEWQRIAVQHARTTIANHLRPDGGSFHVVVFDSVTGRPLERITHQGHADSSTWARGQSWLIYGFTMAYRETGEPDFLDTAQRLADYAVTRLPADGVPCWDYQAPGCPAAAPRDASAAAIMASALIELATFVPGSSYAATAERILATLASPAYFAREGESEALLRHGVGHHPNGSEIDVGLSYADYYFVEALLRHRALQGERPRVLQPRTPRLITQRGELLRTSRERIGRADAALQPALRRLLEQADSALQRGPFTVTAKQRTPPSGDKRDYMSFGPYWWPDTTKPNGLPYVRRDGEVNWDLRRDSDALRLYALTDAVETLALAWYFTAEARYAEHAAALLHTWFIEPATRMNPHLRYGQGIPGVTEGRGIGIIDTRDLGRLTDAAALLAGSPRWPAAAEAELRAWMSAYLQWLRTSEHGLDEADEANNHGTWYDVQVAALALYTGDRATARTVLESSRTRRLASQLDSSGAQPLELARTRSLHYSVENLDAMTRLAELGRHVGVDLWRWQAPNRASLRRAIDFVAPFADPAVAWTAGAQITQERADLFVPVLARARLAFGEAKYAELLEKTGAWNTHRAQLLYPPPARVAADTLLDAKRIRSLMLPLTNDQRMHWSAYLRRSDQQREGDRATLDEELRAHGRQTFTPAPAGRGFTAAAALEQTAAGSAQAKKLADHILTYQTPSGGWSKRIDFSRPRSAGQSFASETGWSWIGTLDNGATTEQLRFLGELLEQRDDPRYRRAFERGLDYLHAAQFPNGCWPQVYPLQGGYHDAATFNDDATVNALELLYAVALGKYVFTTAALHERAADAVRRGVDCILASQVVIRGVKTVWGAQHDPLTLEPVKARAYEHASLSGRESAAITNFLMQLDTPSAEVVAAVHAAAAWFNASALHDLHYEPLGRVVTRAGAAPLWARFYELGSNRAIFSDRDGVIRYSLAEISEERRANYLWYTDEPATTLRRYERWARSHPPQSE